MRDAYEIAKDVAKSWCNNHEHYLRLKEKIEAAIIADRMEVTQWLSAEMPCSHVRRHWRPLEGTLDGQVRFERDPERYGKCEICEALADGADRFVAVVRQRDAAEAEVERLKKRLS